MEKLFSVRRRDVIVLIVVVVGGLGFFGYAQGDITMKRESLREKAATHEAELFKDLRKADFDYLVEVDSGKSSGLLGRDWGVVRLYSRKKADTAMDTFTGVEYFYAYEGTGWVLSDTARIDLPEYIYEGYRKLEEAGHEVDDEAYLRYNR